MAGELKMDVRKKLVELLKKADKEALPAAEMGKPYNETEVMGRMADNLIAHGVTVQEWISVKDRLPQYNNDVLVYRPNMAMKILVDNYAGYYGEDDDEWHEGWEKYGKDMRGKPIITHWAYLPQPPKGE